MWPHQAYLAQELYILGLEGIEFSAGDPLPAEPLIRGAHNRLAQLTPEERARGVVAQSSGNHAQAVAYAARELGIRAVIVMPDTSPEVKVANTRGFGAIQHGRSLGLCVVVKMAV